MKKMYASIYKLPFERAEIEEAKARLEDELYSAEAEDLVSYDVDLNKTDDGFLLEMTKHFRHYIDIMYMMSCVLANAYGSALPDSDVIKVANAIYRTWLKDETNRSICYISDHILQMIESGKITVDEALEKSGRELIGMID